MIIIGISNGDLLQEKKIGKPHKKTLVFKNESKCWKIN